MDRDANIDKWQAFRIVFAVMWAIAMMVLVFGVSLLSGGCSSPDCGSKTIVGNHYALPKLSNDTSNTDIEVYESTEGAVVCTRKDMNVEIEYQNVYTNHILGVWNKIGSMVLKVVIEPVECSGSREVDASEGDEDEKR